MEHLYQWMVDASPLYHALSQLGLPALGVSLENAQLTRCWWYLQLRCLTLHHRPWFGSVASRAFGILLVDGSGLECCLDQHLYIRICFVIDGTVALGLVGFASFSYSEHSRDACYSQHSRHRSHFLCEVCWAYCQMWPCLSWYYLLDFGASTISGITAAITLDFCKSYWVWLLGRQQLLLP